MTNSLLNLKIWAFEQIYTAIKLPVPDHVKNVLSEDEYKGLIVKATIEAYEKSKEKIK